LHSAQTPHPKTLFALLVTLLLAVACAPGTSTPSAGPAQRIVSLMPAVTETVIALGAGDRLVGIGKFDPEVPGRPDLPRLGDAFGVGLEAVSALEPDLILVNAKNVASMLAPLGRRARIETVPTDRLAQVLSSTRRLAELLGEPERGEALVAEMNGALAAARARAEARARKGGGRPRVLIVLQHRPFYVAGAGSYVHELLELVGAENVAADLEQAWPTLGEEALVARAPEVILDTSAGVEEGVDPAALASRWARFDTVPAVREGRVLPVTDQSLFRPGPRIPMAIELLERLLFGASGEGR